GCVGAGTGTMAFGLKGGIGTSSRVLPDGCTLGVLVQSNFGGILSPLLLGGVGGGPASDLPPAEYGSIIIVIATNAPLSDRNLKRVARRAFAGMARTGASFSNGSGDYAIAFSVAEDVRRKSASGLTAELPNDAMSPLFQAVNEATEEAIYNSLLFAKDTRGFNGSFAKALVL
ncbi:MAG: P1 family peptidase, partial [Anaerolineae bacterium]